MVNFVFVLGHECELVQCVSRRGIEVSAIYIYPIKACKGIALQSVEVDEPGPLYDRRWVIVDKNGDFVTQRSIPRMAQIAPSLIVKDDTTGSTRTVDTNLLKRSTPTHLRSEWMVDGSYMEAPILSQDSNPAPERKTITVWNDTVANAADQGDNVSEWLSATLEKEGLRLVYMDDSCIREITCKNYGPENEDAATKPTYVSSHPIGADYHRTHVLTWFVRLAERKWRFQMLHHSCY